MLRVSGRTVDGKPVISGIWQFRGTYGAPFELIFEKLQERGYVPDMGELLREVPLSRQEEMRLALKETYGTGFIQND